MAEVSLLNEEEIRDTIALVRKDTPECNWCALTYENAKSTRLHLLGKGSAGLAELTPLLQPDQCTYALLVVHDRPDELVEATTKFVWIIWIGKKVARMQRARQGPARSSIQEIFGSCHVTISCEELDEITEDIVMEKVRNASGSAVHVLNKDGTKASAELQAKVGAITKIGTSGEVKWKNLDHVNELIAKVRSDSDPTTWVFCCFDEENALDVKASGEGNVDDEMVKLLEPTVAGYGLVRKTEIIDESETIKFAYIVFLGDQVERRLKSKLSTFAGEVKQVFSPHHVTIEANNKSEVSDAIIIETIAKASGTKSHVLKETIHVQPVVKSAPKEKASETEAPAAEPEKKVNIKIEKKPKEVKKFEPAQGGDGPQFEDIDTITDAIADVRNDETDTKWMMVGITPDSNKKVKFLQKGSGEIDEMLPLLDDKNVCYGLIRRTLKIDDSITVKFVMFAWTGDNIPRMLRAKLGIYAGHLHNLLQPYHCDFCASNHSEFTEDIIQNLIATYSGQKSHLVEKP